jgi:hypothetical protein
MDAMRLNAPGVQPPGQPEAITASLKGERDAGDRPAGGDRLLAPALHQAEQGFGVGIEFLLRLTFNTGHETGDTPAGPAHLDDDNERGMLVKGGEGSAQIICTGVPGHGASPSIVTATTMPPPRRLSP